MYIKLIRTSLLTILHILQLAQHAQQMLEAQLHTQLLLHNKP
jgi:hypothetical protein